MHKSNSLIIIIALLSFISKGKTQNLSTEIGIGLGNVIAQEHSLGKAEIYINLIKSFKFGQIGLDFSSGGNFIPGSRSMEDGNIETLSPNDARFGSISILYRKSIKNYFFIEPRLGYSSLSHYVHTDNKTRISQQNFTYGIGIGTNLFKNFSFSLRYQHFGKTPAFEDTKDMRIVKLNAEPLNLILFRMAYRFSWDNLFKK